jgi:putative IMPACT (imprinted ancient) family translation regulator
MSIKEIQGIIMDYFENQYSNSNKLENLEAIDKFLDTYNHPQLNQEDINHLNRVITSNEIEAVTESPKRKVHSVMNSLKNSQIPS